MELNLFSDSYEVKFVGWPGQTMCSCDQTLGSRDRQLPVKQSTLFSTPKEHPVQHCKLFSTPR